MIASRLFIVYLSFCVFVCCHFAFNSMEGLAETSRGSGCCDCSGALKRAPHSFYSAALTSMCAMYIHAAELPPHILYIVFLRSCVWCVRIFVSQESRYLASRSGPSLLCLHCN
uniref:Uncharacterized protein n=1 Tax=Ixodes scapularis TaxID=6945 RepID=A0A4D5RF79_IXOSC